MTHPFLHDRSCFSYLLLQLVWRRSGSEAAKQSILNQYLSCSITCQIHFIHGSFIPLLLHFWLQGKLQQNVKTESPGDAKSFSQESWSRQWERVLLNSQGFLVCLCGFDFNPQWIFLYLLSCFSFETWNMIWREFKVQDGQNFVEKETVKMSVDKKLFVCSCFSDITHLWSRF